ncbi:peptidoglycan-binding domain-containing protein [Methylomarinum vadi]|uniref:peptidoglycan-binding domain-containing protein n=1 Tax=Methylomarinum vadi TaxID=438855 RepID=UPI0004DF6C52|nr:peptidoglycan-binding domain-containing protein [Methylomarinum vadi]
MNTLSLNSQGDFVREIQGKLLELGFEPGPIDGLFGECTRRAVVCFQQSRKLEADGIVGPITANALGIKVDFQVLEIERANFRALLLTNPNYFGNKRVSKYQPVKQKKSDTSYEELKCVGYNPHVKQLYAVVHIKRDYGFLGGLCSTGSTEYIRFYIDWNNDGRWIDAGLTHIAVFDIPGDKPLEYSLTLDIDPVEKPCAIENLPKVRAILSWNDLPTAGDPDYLPVWGNMVEVRIQIDTLNGKTVALGDFLKLGKATFPDSILDNIDLNQPVSLADTKELSIGDLASAYKEKGVPAHRFTFSTVKKLSIKSVDAGIAHDELSELLSGYDMKVSEVVEALAATDGDTRYEELKCVGYDSRRRHLTGILNVKLPYGYSGSLCKKGSLEYVAFWEWDEIEAIWLYLGTAVVNTHDVKSMPSGGIQYAVSLSADFSHRRRPCTKGPSEARIRAILSWEEPPPPHNPNWVPKWGNREETRIHIKPGPIVTGEHIPYIETVGNMHVCDINQGTGLATGEGIIAHFDADRSPFAQTLTVTGYIDNPPAGVMEGAAIPLKYKISVRPYDPISPQPWQSLHNDFSVWVREEIGLNPPIHKKIKQKIDPADGCYTYLEDPGGSHERHYVIPVLAKWHTSAPHTGLWEIRIMAKLPSDGVIYGGVLICAADGSTRSVVRVRLDNKEPEVAIGLTGYQRGSDPTVHPIGTSTSEKCGKFVIGDVLHGVYDVKDAHFGTLTLTVAPSGPAHGTTVNPPLRRFDIVPTSGEFGTWTLDTKNMEACGYIVRLWARDRAIVDSGYIGLRNTDDVGFCLEEPLAEESA